MPERPTTKGGGAGDHGADPQPIDRGMGREAGREEQPVVEEPREGPTGGWLRWERPAGATGGWRWRAEREGNEWSERERGVRVMGLY